MQERLHARAMQLGQHTLALRAEEGARQQALALLAEADRAAQWLVSSTSGEALHDFRVALRRLRSLVRAFEPWLPSVRRRHVKRLKKIANSTNRARDVEVQLAWLRGQRRTVTTASDRAGYELVVDRLEAQLHDGPQAARVAERYRRLSAKLGRRLSQPVVSGPTHLRAVLATLLRERLDALRRRMALIGGPGDQVGIHRARIEGKRLRYLVEPLHGSRCADARKPIHHLKQVQDLLGSLHDAHVLAAELKEVLSATSATSTTSTKERRAKPASVSQAGDRRRRSPPSANPRAGIIALARRLRQHRDALHASMEREWRAGGMEQLTREVLAVAAALEAPTVGSDNTSSRPPSTLVRSVPHRRGRPASGETR